MSKIKADCGDIQCKDTGSNNPCVYGQETNFYWPSCTDPAGSHYIQCSQWGQAYDMACGPGTVWNQCITTCDWPPDPAKVNDEVKADNGYIVSDKDSAQNATNTLLVGIAIAGFVFCLLGMGFGVVMWHKANKIKSNGGAIIIPADDEIDEMDNDEGTELQETICSP